MRANLYAAKHQPASDDADDTASQAHTEYQRLDRYRI